MTYNPRAPRERKLTREQVREVVERYEAGERIKDIAESLGVSSPAISYHAAKHTILRRDKPISHGTRKGYQQHRARGGYPCDDCRRANSEYMQNYAGLRGEGA